MKEIWKDIKGYEGIYKVSNKGRVKSFHRQPRIINPSKTTDGYKILQLCKNGEETGKYIHRLVAKHFVDGYEDGLEVNHIDGNILNNYPSNLEWCTHEENISKGWDNNQYSCYAENSHHSKLTYDDIIDIKQLSGSMTQKEIAKKYGISQPHVCDIINNRTWKRGKNDNVK